VRTVGGEIGAASSLAPKVGPLGLVSVYQGIGLAGSLVQLSQTLVHAYPSPLPTLAQRTG
jgi:hypothetical protein